LTKAHEISFWKPMCKSRNRWLFHSAPVAAASAVAALIAAAPARAENCALGPARDAARNAASFQTLRVAPFRRPEIGWAVYEAWIKADLGTSCSATTPRFAADLARFRAGRGLAAGGVMDARTLAAFSQIWAAHRPFVRVSKIACPAPPAASTLATALPAESYGGKVIQLRPGALTAYRRMYAAARAAGVTAGAPSLLTLFSGFRDPAADRARCAAEGNCQGVSRASCSAHLTGLAMDLTLDAAPGHTVDSADDVNRLYMSHTPAYRWLVANAGRFGFVNYVFEPWHWEWTGESP
jgi:D-alanyl-D-alanine carboxypeptidase